MRCCVLWAKAHLKWTISKWKSVLWSDESKFDILVGNHGWFWKALWMLKGIIKVLEQHMLPSRRCVFQQDDAKPHTAAITRAWFRSRRVQVLNWPACSPDISPIENIWRIIKIRQRWSQTVQQLETYIRQEWDQIPTPKLQKIITSMPGRLQNVLKRRDATLW